MSTTPKDDLTVTISKKEHQRLLKSERKLEALEGAGVDNWEGYDYAMEILNAETN